MQAKTKAKALALSLCAALLVAASVLTTLAFLQARDAVKNTFTVGQVAIRLDEAKVREDGTAVTPAQRVKENAYKLMPGHTYGKDPTVTVLRGSEESYIRMRVTFNNASQIIALCTDPAFADDGPTGIENAYPLLRMVNFLPSGAAKWDGIIPDNMTETEQMLADSKYFAYDKASDTLTYYFYYTETVAAPDGDVVLPTLFDSIVVPQWVTGQQLAALDGFEISALAEAIQADGFANADAAWKEFR